MYLTSFHFRLASWCNANNLFFAWANRNYRTMKCCLFQLQTWNTKQMAFGNRSVKASSILLTRRQNHTFLEAQLWKTEQENTHSTGTTDWCFVHHGMLWSIIFASPWWTSTLSLFYPNLCIDQRSKLTFSTFNCKMVAIKRNSVAKKKTWKGRTLNDILHEGLMRWMARFQHFALLQYEKEKEETV